MELRLRWDLPLAFCFNVLDFTSLLLAETEPICWAWGSSCSGSTVCSTVLGSMASIGSAGIGTCGATGSSLVIITPTALVSRGAPGAKPYIKSLISFAVLSSKQSNLCKLCKWPWPSDKPVSVMAKGSLSMERCSEGKPCGN